MIYDNKLINIIYNNKLYILYGLLLLSLIIIFLIINKSNNKQISQYTKDVENISKILMNDARLNRLLMIELINTNIDTNLNTNKNYISNTPTNDKNNIDVLYNEEIPSNIITYKKMSIGLTQLGKCLVKYFGATITNKFISLMKQRNEILREFYIKIRNYNYNIDDYENAELDIISLTSKKLENLTRDITDCVASSFNIKDIDPTSNKKRPLETYQRLYNLISMYDKELLNQAKTYVIKHYTISINCSQSSIDLTTNITEELSKLLLKKK
jgi:hypothetical protein